jgi:hypothetical protein
MKKIIFYLLIAALTQVSNFIFTAIPASERAALIALYNNTNGDGWANNSGWKTPPLDTDGFAMPGTEGNWKGAFISADHVTQIFLYNNNLSGSIPSQMGNLGKLKELFLDKNQLSGVKQIEINELERVKINLADAIIVEGYLIVGDQLRKLPIGSTLDKEKGIFYWRPGPGFIGEYRLVFVGTDDKGRYIKKNFIVNIKTKN